MEAGEELEVEVALVEGMVVVAAGWTVHSGARGTFRMLLSCVLCM